MAADRLFETATPCLSLREVFPGVRAPEALAAQWQVAQDGDFDGGLVWRSETVIDPRLVVCVGPEDGVFTGTMKGSTVLDLDVDYAWRARYESALGWSAWSAP